MEQSLTNRKRKKQVNELDRLRQIGLDTGPADPGARSRARARLMAEIESERPSPPLTPRKRSHRRRWLVGVPAVAALVIAALVLSIVLPTRRGGPPPTAAAELRYLAGVAARQPGVSLETGEFAYTRIEGVRDAVFVVQTDEGQLEYTLLIPFVREVWRGADGSGRDLDVTGEAEFSSPADRTSWQQAGAPPLPDPRRSDKGYEAGEFFFVDISQLPSNPGELLARIREGEFSGNEPVSDGLAFRVVDTLLEETYVPPGLRSSLYLAASHLKGIKLDGVVTDRAGREGVGLSFSEGGAKRTVIFDQESSAVLGRELVDTETGLAHESVAIEETGVTTSVTERP
ncbi:MAG: CU044_5270 family protein [Actinomycetota bacterium]